jgi:hypothetical protein
MQVKKCYLLGLCLLYLAIGTANDGLLFYCSFDQGLNADIAAEGTQKPSSSVNAELTEGKTGKGYIQNGKGNLQFPADGNIKADEGTVAMWVKSVNWDGNTRVFRYFFGAGNLQKGHHFQLYKYYNSGLIWLVRNSLNKEQFSLGVTNEMQKWKAGEWHHLAVSWSRKEKRCYLYFDGKRGEAVFPEAVFPDNDAQFGPAIIFNSLVEAPNHSLEDRTVLDEVYIYDRMIGDRGISELMNKSTEKSEARYVIPRLSAPPRIDGAIAPNEYALCFGTNSFVILNSKGFEPREARVFLGYDDRNLYVTMQSQTKGDDLNVEIAAAQKERDSEVWLDDAVELMILPPDGVIHQIVVNSIGTIYDAKAGNAKWNGDYEIANRMEGNWWVCELKIPFAEFGLSAPAQGESWKMHVARDWKNPFVFTSLADTAAFSDHKTMPRFVFGGAGDGAWSMIGLEKALSRYGSLLVTATNSTSVPAEYTARFYAVDNQNRKIVLDEKKQTAASGKTAKLEVAKDLGALDNMFQNKLGIEVLRNGEVLRQSEYTLKVFPPLALSSAVISERKSVQYVVDLTGLAASLESLAIEYRLLRNGKPEKNWRQEKVDRRLQEKLIEIGDFTSQDKFILQVRVLDRSGKELESASTDFAFPGREPWTDTRAGLADAVPAPWAELQYDGHAVGIWGRQYTFGADALPASITSLGKELLAAPAALRLQSEGQAFDWSQMKLEFTGRKAGETTFRAVAASGSLAVEINGRLEYDGFLWYEIRLIPQGKVQLDRFVFDLPLRKSEAKFVTVSRADSGYARYGKLDRFLGAQPFCQQILFCNDERGLGWFTESDEFFRPAAAANALEVSEKGDDVLLRVHFLQEPLEITSPLTYRFGMQATPLKKMLEGWQGYLMSYRGKYNSEAVMTQLWSWSKWYGFMRPHTDDLFRKNIADLRRLYPDMRIQPYLCEYIFSTLAPEYKTYAEEWVVHPKVEIMEFGPKYPGTSMLGCIGAKGYREFWVDSFARFIDEYDIDGCYWDSIDPRACSNPYHGHGYTDESGVRRQTTDILGSREFYKRNYTTLKAKRPRALITGHSSQRRNLSTIAFCDVVYDGEQFISNVAGNPNYCKVINDDFCRIFLGPQFGLIPLFLPAYYFNSEEVSAIEKPTESIYLHALIYNFLVHSHRVNNTVTDRVLDITRAFGMGDARYIAPYETAALAAILQYDARGRADVRMSVYAKKDKALIVLGNFGDEEAPVQLRLQSFSKLTGLSANSDLRPVGDGFETVVPPAGFIILLAD